MNLSNHYWYFKSALSHKLCDDIIAYGLSENEDIGRIGNTLENTSELNKDQIKKIKKKRNSDIVWLHENWIYKEIHPFIHMANKNAGWNFQWDSTERLQFTKYKLNQYYDWHTDAWAEPYKDNGSFTGKIRKLSVTCQLTDGSEYEGGELEFDFRDYDPHMRDESKHLKQAKEILPKGSIIVFPSFLWHRVKPVRKGVRYSLVAWNLGYPHK
jgi:PKHD-type hydroxylase